MSIIDAVFGNASQVDAGKIQKEHQEIFIPGEEVKAAFQLVRDQFIFTDKRLVLVDKQGLTGKKVEYLSVPYKSIKYFSIETAGRFDRDAELKIWIGNKAEPTIEKELKKGIDIISLQRTLAYYLLNG
ncbi:MAG: PH domain-containing protein [Anaerolineales bacterium]|nr:PH domain-containing protein [Anaerolineales bacterium]